jgi:hypothetical protein
MVGIEMAGGKLAQKQKKAGGNTMLRSRRKRGMKFEQMNRFENGDLCSTNTIEEGTGAQDRGSNGKQAGGKAPAVSKKEPISPMNGGKRRLSTVHHQHRIRARSKRPR